jgi:DNA primase
MEGLEVSNEVLLRHYAVAGPLMERVFGAIPFVWSTLPGGFDGPVLFHGPLSPLTKPKAPVIDVPTASGVHRYPALSAARIEGLVPYGAVQLYSWSPVAGRPTRVRFARLLVGTAAKADRHDLHSGLVAVESVLRGCGVQWLRVYDGGNGAALWIPFSDAPEYADVRAWLHACCLLAVRSAPNVVTLEPNSHGGPPVHLHVQSNAVGRFSVLPYSVRGMPGYPVAVPIDPSAASRDGDEPFANGNVCVENFAEWLRDNGEAFSSQPAAFYEQRFADVAKPSPVAGYSGTAASGLSDGGSPPAMSQRSHGPIVRAAIAVLQDGRSHTADDILALAVARGLLDATVTRKYVYTSLIEYVARAKGNGRRPAIAQNGDRSFRMNEPPDDWPELPPEPRAECSAEIVALIERLHRSAAGPPDEFEQAVCDAFDALGFAATHVGGQKAPDGYADAPLGSLGYRVTIECKSSDEGINDPSVFETAKYKQAYGAQYCALVARAFSGEIELVKELDNHGVSAWTVDDLERLLRMDANPYEMWPLFEAGFAADALDNLCWDRVHGECKRVRLIADAIVRTGRATQAAYRANLGEAPHITEDVAMVLVDQDLAAQGSAARCNRDDVRAAIQYLSNPLVGSVVRDGDGSVIVVGNAE